MGTRCPLSTTVDKVPDHRTYLTSAYISQYLAGLPPGLLGLRKGGAGRGFLGHLTPGLVLKEDEEEAGTQDTDSCLLSRRIW